MKKIIKKPSCDDTIDTASLPLEVAIDKILSAVKPMTDVEKLNTYEALNRIAYTNIESKINVPQHDNSAMDGYAIKFSDLGSEAIISLEVIGQSLAGHPFSGKVKKGQCVRIMTGGVMPSDTDSVVIQEHVERHGETIQLGNKHRYEQNVRKSGEDIKKGMTVINRGTQLTPSHLGLLASVGVKNLDVFRQLRVCIFSTGDELRPVGSTLSQGEIYDSNRYSLSAMLKRLNVMVDDLGAIKDDQIALRKAFKTASSSYDAIITSGGVSVGDMDYTKQIFCETGAIEFWKIAVKPGRPVAFGKLGDGVYFGLPGNPVSVMATFYILVQPALKKMMGCSEIKPFKLLAQCVSGLRKRTGRSEIQRGILRSQQDGLLTVESTGSQGSGIMSSMTNANCFIYLPAETETVGTGGKVWVIPFAGLI